MSKYLTHAFYSWFKNVFFKPCVLHVSKCFFLFVCLSTRWLEAKPMVKVPTLRTSQTRCRTTLRSESPPSWFKHSSHSLWILTTPTLPFSQFSLNSFIPPSSVSFDTPPPTASMCLLISLKTHTKYRFCDMKSSQVVQKKTNDESFCIRNYFTLLCIMFLHNFYLYMTIKEYK